LANTFAGAADDEAREARPRVQQQESGAPAWEKPVNVENSHSFSAPLVAPTVKRPSLAANPAVQVLVAIVAGLVLGLTAPGLAAAMKPLGDIFLNLIRMAIGPVIFLSVTTGVSSMGSLRRVGRVGGLALLYFEVITTAALGLGLLVANVVRPGSGLNAVITGGTPGEVARFAKAAQEQHGIGDFFLGIVPENIVRSFAEGHLLQIVFFSLMFGLALSAAGPAGKPVEDFLKSLSTIFFRLIDMVMRVAPLGAFGALAYTISHYGAGAIGSLGAFVLCVYAGYAVFVAGVLGLVARFAGVSLWRLIAYLREELLIVLGTSTTEAVLLPVMEKMERLGCDSAVVGLVLPTGYSFNLDGAAIYLAVAVLFIAQAYNIHMDIGQQLGILAILVITSKGGAGVAGAAFVVLGATIASTHILPIEGLALLFGVDRIVNSGRAMTNLIGNTLATLVVAKLDGSFDAVKGVETYRAHFANPSIAAV
jgi:aerobic C4-dicarboxylate transport protein